METVKLFNDDLFIKIIGSRGEMVSWKAVEMDNSFGYLSGLCAEGHHPIGHFRFDIIYNPSNGGAAQCLSAVLKSKATGNSAVEAINSLAEAVGHPISDTFRKYKSKIGYCFTDVRELEVFKIDDPRFTDIVPGIYYVHSEKDKELYLIVMEFLAPPKVILMDRSTDAPEVWTDKFIKISLRDIAGFHSIYLGKVESLLRQPWMEAFYKQNMMEMTEFWEAMAANRHRNAPECITPRRYKILQNIIHNLDHIWTSLEASPRTLIHGDFKPRNACIRIPSTPESSDLSPDETVTRVPRERLCLYDWECATVHVPQSDIVEFLAFALSKDVGVALRLQYVEFYRKALEKQSGMELPKPQFQAATLQ